MANETVTQFRVEVRITGLVVAADGDGSRLVVLEEYDKTFGDGTSADQVQWVWNDSTRALATTNETIDMDGVTDFRGAAMSDNTTAKVLYIRDLGSTTGQKLTIGGGDFASASGPLVDSTDKMVCQAGGLILMVAPVDGYPITASTGDGLRVESSASMNYRLIMAGDNT